VTITIVNWLLTGAVIEDTIINWYC